MKKLLLLGLLMLTLTLNVACAGTTTVGSASPGSVTGTLWRLVEIDGSPAVQGFDATLELTKDGRASGRGTCNRFSGPVAISGDRIEFGPLVSTKMACADAAANAQEAKYLGALQKAERFDLEEDDVLLVYSSATEKPLRFVPK